VKSSVPFFGEYFVSAVDSQMYFMQGQSIRAVHEFYNSLKLTRIDRQRIQPCTGVVETGARTK